MYFFPLRQETAQSCSKPFAFEWSCPRHAEPIARTPQEEHGLKGVVVKIMLPFWLPVIVRHLLFRVPKKGHNLTTTLVVLNGFGFRGLGFRVEVQGLCLQGFSWQHLGPTWAFQGVGLVGSGTFTALGPVPLHQFILPLHRYFPRNTDAYNCLRRHDGATACVLLALGMFQIQVFRVK